MRKLFFIIILALCKANPSLAHTLESIKKQVSKAERHYNLPEGLLDSIITLESNYNSEALNPKNTKNNVFVSSYGLGQLTIATARGICSLSPFDILNPIKNIYCSAKVLRYQLDRYENSVLAAVAAYNAGTPFICNGENFTRELNDKIQILKKSNKFIKCSEPGKFLNQEYVNNFLDKYKEMYPVSYILIF